MRGAFIAEDFRRVEKNTLRGFFDLVLPSGLVLKECSWHCQADKQWIGLPGKPQLDRDGRHRVDDTGKRLYSNIVEIRGKEAASSFQRQALVALHALVGERAETAA